MNNEHFDMQFMEEFLREVKTFYEATLASVRRMYNDKPTFALEYVIREYQDKLHITNMLLATFMEELAKVKEH